MIILKDVVYVGIGDNIILPCQVSGIMVMRESKMTMTMTKELGKSKNAI